MRLFRFETGEVDHIAARDEAEARAHFHATYEDDMDPAVTEVAAERWASMNVRDDDACGGKTTAAAIIGDPASERDAFLVCSTCW